MRKYTFKVTDPFLLSGTIELTEIPIVPVDVYRPPYYLDRIQPSSDSKRVFVSISGNDQNTGLSESSPKRTINAAVALLRNGFPDWLYLKRGDIWTNENLGNFLDLSGRNANEPMVVTSYGSGTTRPRLNTGVESAISVCCDDNKVSQHIVISGLHFNAHLYTGGDPAPHGIYLLGRVHDWTLEDLWIDHYFNNVTVQAYPGPTPQGTVRFIGNIITGNFKVGEPGHTQGMYLSGAKEILLDGNVFTKNGFNPNITDARSNIFRHAIYAQDDLAKYDPIAGTGCTFRNNLFYNTTDIQMRAGGLAENNLISNVPIALLGGSDFSGQAAKDVVQILNNVIIEGNDYQQASPALPRGWSIRVQNASKAIVSGNIIANNHGGSPAGITLVANVGTGIDEAELVGNIVYEWKAPALYIQGGLGSVHKLTWQRNLTHETSFNIYSQWDIPIFSNIISDHNIASMPANTIWGQTPQSAYLFVQFFSLMHDTTSEPMDPIFPDPNRNLASYHAALNNLGSSTNDAFMQSLLSRYSRLSWDSNYSASAANAYIRKGFGIS